MRAYRHRRAYQRKLYRDMTHELDALREYQQLKSAWLDGEAGEASHSVAFHVTECSKCAQEVEAMRSSGQFLRTLIELVSTSLLIFIKQVAHK